MKLYSINKWAELYENNRSRTVVKLSWVAIPNRHDGETFTNIMGHKDGAIIFAAFILMAEIASKCSPRGSLIKDNGTPHTASSLSAKCRAPASWFEIAFSYLEKNSDWLDIKEFADTTHKTDTLLTVPCQLGDEGRKEGMEGKEGGNGLLVKEVFDTWNASESLTTCLVISDKRRRSFEQRAKDKFFVSNWRTALDKIIKSDFCGGRNERGWRSNFDWFLQPDTVAKIMEGKYDNHTGTLTNPKKIKPIAV